MSNVVPMNPQQAEQPVMPMQPITDISKMSRKEVEKILEDCNKKFEECKTARINFERDWYYNMAFYFGRQWVEWIGTTSSGSLDFFKLYEPAAPKWRVRITSNRIRPIVRKELTKLTKERFQFYVLPNTTEDADIAASRAAEAISEYLFTETRFVKKERSTVFWALMCGTSFIKTYFDHEKPDTSGIPGSLIVDPVNAFHLFAPDLEQEEIEWQPYVIHASAKDTQWVQDTYGQPVTGDVKSSGLGIEQKFFSALGLRATNTRDLTYVKEVWYKPCRNYPQGALIIWANESLLGYYPQWPLPYPEFPFSKIDHIPTGRFYADSVIKDLIPLQKEYNRSISQLVEAKNRMAKPQLIAPKGSIDPNKMTSEPGLIITYTPGFNPPTPLPLTQMPSYVLDHIERIKRDLDDISNQHEVTQGRTPPGVEAASAIAYLQEESDTILSHTTQSIEEAVEKVGKQMLALVNANWDAQRKVKVTGVNNMLESFMFSKADIAGNTDFRVQAGSSAPRSRAAKQAFLTELGKLGWIQPDRVLRYMDMVETNKLYEDMQVSIRQVQRENIRMKEPQQNPETGLPMFVPLQINQYDDDIAHINGHSDFMRTQEYEILDEQAKNNFLQHLMLHQQRMVNMQQMQQNAQGAPPEQMGQGAPPEQ